MVLLRNTFICSAIVVTMFTARLAVSQSWETFRKDDHRTGVVESKLTPTQLQLAWEWTAELEPFPAWDGPARWDAYNLINDLPAMRQYDACFHPVSDGQIAVFGSSSQDFVRAVDLTTGQQVWQFIAGGPVRLAPTIYQDRVLFGCDDGYVYCLNKADGRQLWKFSPSVEQGAEQRMLINNDRLISCYPIRTGVVVRDGIAYFGASLLPWRESYLCAIDVDTGKFDGADATYVTRHEDATLEGNMLIAGDRLIVPQGRIAPLLFDRTNGTKKGNLPGGGGVTAVVTDLGDVVRAEGGREARSGQVAVFRGKERIASFPRGRAIVLSDQEFYVIDGQQLFAASRVNNELRWSCEVDEPLELIKYGDAVIVGGANHVTAVSAVDGSVLWSVEVDGRAFGLACAGQHLLVSTDKGTIQAFELTNSILKSDKLKLGNERRESATPNASQKTPAASQPNDRLPVNFLAWGPYTRFIRPGQIEINYGTHENRPSVVDVITDTGVRRIKQDQQTTSHSILIDDIPHRRQLQFQICDDKGESAEKTDSFLVDTHFDWTMSRPSTEPDALVRELIAKGPNPRGLVVVIGAGQHERAKSIAMQSDFHVILVEADAEQAMAVRTRWSEDQQVVYGGRLCVVNRELGELPSAFASAVVDIRGAEEVRRIVRPAGGILHNGEAITWKRGSLPGSGTWSHMYGSADNSAFGGEELSGISDRDQLTTQWIGRPGPRYQTDRQNRKASPLAAGGRLFLQGQQRMIALDNYSGAVLWSVEAPTVMRWNVPHDCSNWCADEDGVFVAANHQAWYIDGRTGEIARRFGIPDENIEQNHWGYIARHKDALLGTVVRASAVYSRWWGPSKWFDSTGGEDTHVVAGDKLFSMDAKSGKLNWQHDGIVIQPTITILDDRVYFIESKSPDHLIGETRRLSLDANQQHEMVCLDCESGQELWRNPIKPFVGHLSSFYLAGGGDKEIRALVLVASEAKAEAFTAQAFDPETGELRWSQVVDWESNHHGKHISRPAIQGDLIYLRPEVLKLASGESIHRGFPDGHGCSSYTASTNGIFTRLGETTWWDARTQKVNRFKRIRTDCWLSVIPAQGMLISAEGGGGCSCGSWLETSLGLLPRNIDEDYSIDD